MDADLDTLCTVVYCTADDLLPEARANARRRITDAELVTLCVAQAIMGVPSDRRFLAVAKKRLIHLFPELPSQSAYWRRRRRLGDAIEWLMAVFASQSPGFSDPLLLCDSTPVECGRSRETAKRSALADAAGYGYCAAHTRWYWGFRLHLLAAPDGTPRAFTLADPARGEREVALELLERAARGGEVLVADKGYAGREFAASAAEHERPRRASGAQGRARPRSAPRAHPPADRVDLLDLQGPAHAGAPWGAHLGGTARAHPRSLPLPRGLHQP